MPARPAFGGRRTLPLIPLVLLFDGIVSVLRTYSVAELEELVASVEADEGWEWRTGTLRIGSSPLTITMLTGRPT